MSLMLFNSDAILVLSFARVEEKGNYITIYHLSGNESRKRIFAAKYVTLELNYNKKAITDLLVNTKF